MSVGLVQSVPKSSDATLSALTVSDGSNNVALTPAFASDTRGYTSSVANSVSIVTVTPTVSDENATVTVEGSAVTSGTASSPISLTAGVAEVIDIVVTAQDETTRTYTVTVTRTKSSDATLKALTVSDGTNDVSLTPNFASTTTGYTATVASSVSSVTVTPTVNDPNATVTVTPTVTDSNADMTVEDTTVTSGTASSAIPLTEGAPRDINVVVTAQDGTTTGAYTITVTREAAENEVSVVQALESIVDLTLKALTVSDGTNNVPLAPAFASDTADYTASVANSVSSVTVTPTVNDDNATVTVEGSTVTSGTASPAVSLTAGVAEVIDIVVSQGETSSTYTVTVTREKSSDATLSALVVSDGTNDVPLTPAFASGTADYRTSVGNSVSTVTVTPTVSDESATVTVEDLPVSSGSASSPIPLIAGASVVIDIAVTAQNGITDVYTVTVTREAAAQPVKQTLYDENETIGRCRPYRDDNEEGLRVCQLGYEGGETIMMLTLPGPAPAGGTIVTLATDPKQEATSDDFTMPSTITIPEGVRSGIITIAITADDEDEYDETINIYACTHPGCDPLNLDDGDKHYNHGIYIQGTRVAGGL